MTTFDEREKGEEAKFHRDQELAFKARARRNHLFGLWAAGKLGLGGDAAENYARELMAAAFGKHGDEAVLAKIEADFKAKGVDVTLDAARLRLELDRCLAEAKKQLGVPR
ncbi:MAG: DUF1476 domain-containing protein [Alphaproteobacteria bacterium]|nr:DUF1476 domain-containing protein [Alphaproteobacteria bacterium]